MLTNKQVCDQITAMYPDFGHCGETLDVSWDSGNQAWVVDFEYRGNKIRHFLENKDAADCIHGDQCVGLSIEFGQFR